MESIPDDGHLHPGHAMNGHRRSPSLRYINNNLLKMYVQRQTIYVQLFFLTIKLLY